MGGYGSGRWGWYSRRTTVEECLTIDVNWLQRTGRLLKHKHTKGVFSWTDGQDNIYSVSYEIMTDLDIHAEHGLMRLSYRTDDRPIFTEIALTTTPANLGGGHRYWFLCPYCSRRVGTLHLPPGARDFKCRTCHDLTYASCQDSHKYDVLYNHIGGNLGISGKMVEQLLRKG